MYMIVDELSLARAVHVLSLVHWIGGLAAVTTIVLPQARRMATGADAIAHFESFERLFARQVRVTILLAGASGVYMLWRQYGWQIGSVSQFWWIYLMIFVWAVFACMVYLIEPLFLHDTFRAFAMQSPKRAFTIATRLHAAALLISTIAIGAGVIGAHGGM